jgi:hypothetical protein
MSEFARHLSVQLSQRVNISQIRAIAEWANSELLDELTEHLNLLATQPLSPGLRSALATTRRRIAKHACPPAQRDPR